MQYVGARYVPKFMGLYDATQTYEGLCVVDNGMGTSYITRKPTPAGTPLTDTDYYAVYGASSGAIINLQNQIGDLSSLTTTDQDSLVDAINEVNALMTGTEALNVDMFGAAGDGATDDSQAFTDAFAAASIICLTEGKNYLIKDVTMPKGCKLYGNGATITFNYELNKNCLELSGDNEIIGVKFTDNFTSLDNDPNGIIYAFEVDNVSVKYCEFNNIHIGYCAYIDHSTHIEFLHNKINNYSWCGIMCLHTCKYIDVEYNYVYNGQAQIDGNRYPICVSGYRGHNYGPAEFVKCNYNYIEDLTSYWEGIDSHGVVNAEFIGNTIKGTVYGIVLGVPGTSSGIITYNNTNVTIKDNYISTYSAPALGTPIYNRGISVSGTVDNGIDNLIIENNYIICNDATATATALTACIGVNANKHVRNVAIRNNKVVGSPDGIGVTSQYELASVEVSNNDIEAIGSINSDYAGISLKEATSNYSNIKILDNYIHGLADNHVCYRGPASAGVGGQLVTYKNNVDTDNYGSNLYTTTPQNSLAAATKAVGKIGDFIENKYPSTAAMGWYCRGTGNWLEIAGTPQ